MAGVCLFSDDLIKFLVSKSVSLMQRITGAYGSTEFKEENLNHTERLLYSMTAVFIVVVSSMVE